MSDLSPRAWHCDPMARLGLWAVAGSVIFIRNVMQIDRLQVKKIEWKPHGRNLSHCVLSCYHADNWHAVKSMVDAPHYVRTVKHAKRSRKFNAGVTVLKNKWAGHGKWRVISQATTLQLLCLVMLNSDDKVVDVAKFLKLSFRCFTLTYKIVYFF
jgi:hypothetical protein